MPLAKNIGMKKTGFAGLEKALQKAFTDKVVLPADNSIEQSAETIAEVAREFAPEDTSALWHSIEVKKNKRHKLVVSAEVVINGSTINPKTNSPVALYADYINENLTPYGSRLKLGEKSALKQPKFSDDVGVGGHFIERAMIYSEQHLLDDLIETINKK